MTTQKFICYFCSRKLVNQRSYTCITTGKYGYLIDPFYGKPWNRTFTAPGGHITHEIRITSRCCGKVSSLVVYGKDRTPMTLEKRYE